MRDGDWLGGLLDRIGQPVACELCGALSAAADLAEVTVPGYLIEAWDVMACRLAWVCPACPVP